MSRSLALNLFFLMSATVSVVPRQYLLTLSGDMRIYCIAIFVDELHRPSCLSSTMAMLLIEAQ